MLRFFHPTSKSHSTCSTHKSLFEHANGEEGATQDQTSSTRSTPGTTFNACANRGVT